MLVKELRLGVNVDHVATLRQARGTRYPDPVFAAALAESAGAHQITVHLREDRRHIQDRDLRILRQTVETLLNLEMAATEEMVEIACQVLPDRVTLVPERREERTTEGGLDVQGQLEHIRTITTRLRNAGITVSLFIGPDAEQVKAGVRAGAMAIELHTGDYCAARRADERERELGRLREEARRAAKLGLEVAAGHGLDVHNVGPVAEIPEVVELNIGHSLIGRAVLVGLDRAVKEMLAAMRLARSSLG
ncbi:MAG: pyridoxine 5'-phosphate synthase [Deltaproteobacteria bacterium]|nr:pyridoxine 5'-phosphate synthase [Deltaproteobacteria bacterium]